jgi:Transglutaminase elicitor
MSQANASASKIHPSGIMSGRAIMLILLFWVMVIWLVPLGCKQSDTVGEDAATGPIKAPGVAELERTADATREIKTTGEVFFQVFDSQQFTTRLADLPHSGSVPTERLPYSGYWYAERQGGISVRWSGQSASATEKYDTAFYGGERKSTTWEKQNHGSSSAAEWAGHCNGWSAASTRGKEPFKNVTRGSVTFAPHDVKALMAEIHMSAKYFFLGGVRCEGSSPTRPGGRTDPTVMGDCEDINPGTFHLALENWLGKIRHAIIVDLSSVWNHPVNGFRSQVSTIDVNEATRLVTGSRQGTYKFNPTATSFARVDTTMIYTDGRDYEPLGNVAPHHSEKSASYSYVLELNAAGEVIGGEWAQGSQDAHPDFLWVAFEPVTGNGNRAFGNPYLDVNEVIKIWAESIGADPANPPLDIMEPRGLSNWGKFDGFEVTLDGSDTGAVFLGKKTRINIVRSGNLAGPLSVDLAYNGVALTTLNATGNENLTYDFDAGPGLNWIDFDWKKSGAAPTEAILRFRAIP